MILAIDIGNTNIMLGVYENKNLVAYWRISTDHQKTPDEYAVLLKDLFDTADLKFAQIEGVIISNVVPPLIYTFRTMIEKYFKTEPMMLEANTKTGITIKYEPPGDVGADRIANAVGAFELYGGPVIIVDFGTATTVDAVSQKGEYLGGAIAPGIAISTQALFQHAAKLSRVDIVKPKTAIGRNTISSMQAGIFYGFVGQVDEIVRQIQKELAKPAKVIATGGLAELIATASQTIQEVNPFLTLEGLRRIYERNKKKVG